MGKLTSRYLIDYADQPWKVFTHHDLSGQFMSRDYTKRSYYGKYLLMTGHKAYDRAILITERYPMPVTGDRSLCLKFALFMGHDNDSLLEVYLGESGMPGFGTKLWETRRLTKNTFSGNDWQEFSIQARPMNRSSSDLFFYIVGTLIDPSRFITLDDIEVFNSSDCKLFANTFPPVTDASGLTPTAATPDPKLYFQCKSNGKVIPIIKTCDWTKDCPKGEDEAECGGCSFENRQLCRYSLVSSAKFKFQFSDSAPFGPITNIRGNSALFMVASGSRGRSTLTSPVIQQAFASKSIEFILYYFN